jgi:hypothetical protein
MSSDMEKLILQYPDKNWDWTCLSETNIAVSSSFISKHMDLPWDLDGLVSTFPWEEILPIVLKYPEKEWHWAWISGWPLSNETILLLENKLNFTILSLHADLNFIVSHPHYQWSWSNISDRIDVQLPKYVLDYPDLPWDYASLSKSPFLGTVIIEANIDKPWNWDTLSLNVSINWNFIKKHLDKPWNWEKLSMSSMTTWNIIFNNLKWKWDWKIISKYNSNLSWKIIKKYPQINWDFEALSKNNFGHCKKLNQYDDLVETIHQFKILCNLPKYIKMEIFLFQKTKYSAFEIFHLL